MWSYVWNIRVFKLNKKPPRFVDTGQTKNAPIQVINKCVIARKSASSLEGMTLVVGPSLACVML